MKKLYSIFALAVSGTAMVYGQSITYATHAPVAGDVFTTKSYDSTAAVPKQTGANQTWNFSSCLTSTDSPTSSTFVSASSVPASSMFPGTNIVEDLGGGYYSFQKTSTSSYEYLGSKNGTTSTIILTNSLIYINFPFSMGSSMSDNAAGTLTLNTGSSTFTGTIQYSITQNGTGTGNVILPGGNNISNILQVTTSYSMSQLVNIGFGNATVTIKGKAYNYFASGIKQAVLTVDYSTSTVQIPFGTPTVNTGFSADVNNNLITGLNELNFEAGFQIFPNPGKDYFSVNLSNPDRNECVIHIYNASGTLVKEISLGNNAEVNEKVDISHLTPGIYLVKTNLGERQSVRKLIKE
jgi:hypothetical protein